MGNSLPVMTMQLEQACEKFGLNDVSLSKLYQQFQALDKMNMGALDVNDFYAGIGLKRNFFGDQVFKLVDADGNDEISFYEFVVAACTYCSFSDAAVLQFCFNMFDKDGSGFLEEAEVRHLVTILHSLDANSRGSDTNIKKAMQEFGADEHGRISYDQFLVINKLFPRLFYPAFQVQLRLQHVTLGPAWYDKKMEQQRGERAQLRDQERARKEEEEAELERRRLEEDAFVSEDEDDPYSPAGRGKGRQGKNKKKKKKKKHKGAAEEATRPCGCLGGDVADLVDFGQQAQPKPETRLEARMRNVKNARSKSGITCATVMQVDKKDVGALSEEQITRIMKNRAAHRKSRALSKNRSARVNANQLAKGREARRAGHTQRTGASSVFEQRR